MYARVTFQQGLPENTHTVVASFGDPTGRSDVDFSARDISCRNLYAEKTVAAQDVTVRRAVRSEDFVPGLAGCGFRIGADGRAEARSLTLHETLEVPELRYNKVTAVGGQLWVTSAGTIQMVTPNEDGTYTVELRLEEGEIHEFDVDDILWANFKTPTGFQSGRYRVVENINTSSVKIDLLSGCAPQASMTVVRTGNYSDPDRQNSIYLDGYHGYKRILSGVCTPEIRPENITYQGGCLDGLVAEPFGELSGEGVYCRGLYAVGQVWVQVGDELKEAGAEFKVQKDAITSRVTSEEFTSFREQTAESIRDMVTSGEFTSYREQTAESIRDAVETANKSKSWIEQTGDKIELGISDRLGEVGIKIAGNNKGVHVRADRFDVSTPSGTVLIAATSDGRRVSMRDVNIENGARIGDLDIRNGALWWERGARKVYVGAAGVAESGDSVVGWFEAGQGDPAIRVVGGIDLRGSVWGFGLKITAVDSNYSVKYDDSYIVCTNGAGSAAVTVSLPYGPPIGRTIYVRRHSQGWVSVEGGWSGSPATGGVQQKIAWADTSSGTSNLEERGFTLMLVYLGGIWASNLLRH